VAAPQIRVAVAAAEIESAKRLFLEYAETLGDVDLSYQQFDQELASLPGEYAPPRGTLLLGWLDGEVAGCVAVRPFERDCEMKRLYVPARFRGAGLGRLLVQASIDWARNSGYPRMLLDSLPEMHAAQRLYESFGFVDVEAYRVSPIPTRFMGLDLQA